MDFCEKVEFDADPVYLRYVYLFIVGSTSISIKSSCTSCFWIVIKDQIFIVEVSCEKFLGMIDLLIFLGFDDTPGDLLAWWTMW